MDSKQRGGRQCLLSTLRCSHAAVCLGVMRQVTVAQQEQREQKGVRVLQQGAVETAKLTGGAVLSGGGDDDVSCVCVHPLPVHLPHLLRATRGLAGFLLPVETYPPIHA